MDGDHHDALVGHRKNEMDDHLMDGNRVNRRSGVHPNAQMVHDHRVDLTIDPVCYVRHDQNLVVMTDVNHVNRNSAPRDLTMGGNSDVKNLRVMLMAYLSMSCDRMSRDHLRCDHLMMRHRDMNRMDEMNLDGKILDGK